MKEHMRIADLRKLQDISGHASKRIGPDETVPSMLGHLDEEILELKEALLTGERKKIASELPDAMIFLLKIADHYGIDMSEAVTRKIERNAHKYPMNEVQRLVEEGMTYAEARAHLKAKWDSSRDEEFYID